jgi:hypothetical protein
MSNHAFVVIPISLIRALWPVMQPLMQLVVDASAGEITCDSLLDKAMRGACSIVAVIRIDSGAMVAVNTVEVCTYDSGMKALLIPVVGGTEAFEWGPDFLAECNRLAKDLGCKEMRGFSTRESWKRVLKDYGWHESHFVIARKVES